jgi:hypothetical protein
MSTPGVTKTQTTSDADSESNLEPYIDKSIWYALYGLSACTVTRINPPGTV